MIFFILLAWFFNLSLFGNHLDDVEEDSLCDLYIYQDISYGESPFQKGYVNTFGMTLWGNLSWNKCLSPFLEIKWTKVQGVGDGFSVGLGKRVRTPSYTLGFNTYCDLLNTHIAFFQQIGASFELLSQLFDVRVNAYYPLNGTKSTTKKYDDYIGDYVVYCELREKALKGFDLEVGKRIYFSERCGLYIAGGGYYYPSQCQSKSGVVARIGLYLKNLFCLEAQGYYDNKKCLIGELRAGMKVPFTTFFVNRCENYKCRQFVRRADFIAVEKCCRYTSNY